ncbi:Uncharacterized protein FWK35_00030429, partial [Aphis craccivora]
SENSKNEYNAHLERKTLARKEKNRQKSLASNTKIVVTMDLESVLLCPLSNASAMYYKQKLQVHNFTIYRLHDHDVTLYVWHESNGHVTANEFTSCIIDYISNLSTEVKEVTLISDGCNYQNRNKTLSSALNCSTRRSQSHPSTPAPTSPLDLPIFNTNDIPVLVPSNRSPSPVVFPSNQGMLWMWRPETDRIWPLLWTKLLGMSCTIYKKVHVILIKFLKPFQRLIQEDGTIKLIKVRRQKKRMRADKVLVKTYEVSTSHDCNSSAAPTDRRTLDHEANGRNGESKYCVYYYMEAKAYLKRELYNHKENAKIFPKMMSNLILDYTRIYSYTFYSRQIWLYNLTFVINSEQYQSPKNCYLYTWLENESGRGPNEVCSALLNFLEKIEERIKQYPNPPTTLNLFSDSCSAQNKSQFLISLCMTLKKTCKNLSKQNSLKTTEQKMFKYQKGKYTVGLSSTYNSVPKFTQILKRNANLKNLGDVARLDKINHIKPAKKNNVKKLMKYFVVPEDAEDFYKEVCKGDDDHDSDENDIPCSEEDG